MTSVPIYAPPSEAAIESFQPTWLYIKRHSKTGLLYFGKTINADPFYYKGSGTYWLRHLKVHGRRHVETLWCERFTDIFDLVEFALFFSEYMDIVASPAWANLIPENGLSAVMTEVTKGKIATTLTGRRIPQEVILKRSATLSANILSGETVIVKRKLTSEERALSTEKARTTRANWTEEQVTTYSEALSRANTGKKRTPQQCENIRNGLLNSGYSHSVETRVKIGDAQRGTVKPDCMRFTLRTPAGEELVYEGKIADLCEKFNIGVKYLYLSLKNNAPIMKGKAKGWQLLKKERFEVPSFKLSELPRRVG